MVSSFQMGSSTPVAQHPCHVVVALLTVWPIVRQSIALDVVHASTSQPPPPPPPPTLPGASHPAPPFVFKSHLLWVTAVSQLQVPIFWDSLPWTPNAWLCDILHGPVATSACLGPEHARATASSVYNDAHHYLKSSSQVNRDFTCCWECARHQSDPFQTACKNKTKLELFALHRLEHAWQVSEQSSPQSKARAMKLLNLCSIQGLFLHAGQGGPTHSRLLCRTDSCSRNGREDSLADATPAQTVELQSHLSAVFRLDSSGSCLVGLPA